MKFDRAILVVHTDHSLLVWVLLCWDSMPYLHPCEMVGNWTDSVGCQAFIQALALNGCGFFQNCGAQNASNLFVLQQNPLLRGCGTHEILHTNNLHWVAYPAGKKILTPCLPFPPLPSFLFWLILNNFSQQGANMVTVPLSCLDVWTIPPHMHFDHVTTATCRDKPETVFRASPWGTRCSTAWKELDGGLQQIFWTAFDKFRI